MKKLLLLLSFGILLTSCDQLTKEELTQIGAKAKKESKKSGRELPMSSIQIEVYGTDSARQPSLFQDVVREDRNTAYYNGLNLVEDTLNTPKQANDLGINTDNEVFKVYATPYKYDSVAVIFQRYFNETWYWLKITTYNVEYGKVYLWDNYFKDPETMTTHIAEKILLPSNGVKWWRFYTHSGHKTDRFRMVTNN